MDNTLKVPYRPITKSFPRLKFGITPLDRGYLSNISEKEAERIRVTDFVAAQYLRPIKGNDQLLNGTQRWCLWLEGANERIIQSSPELSKRMKAVKKFRSSSSSEETRSIATKASLAGEQAELSRDYLVIPLNVNEKCEYLPVARLSPDVIANHTLGVIEEDEGFVAGVLSSRIFHLWKKVAAAHFTAKKKITTYALYQTLPMPPVTQEQREDIEDNFDRVLRVRINFNQNNLIELYMPEFKPRQLREAHIRLNKAVYATYGFTINTPEDDICQRLFDLYSQMSQTN